MMTTIKIAAVGMGPANLALAVALDEAGLRDESLFLEKSLMTQWHPGMMVPFAQLDTHFLKDLVTPRNPLSQFTFVNYLHKHGRIEDFINCSDPRPSRMEFEDYLRWVARHFAPRIQYSTKVAGLEIKGNALLVKTRNIQTGQLGKFRTENLILGTGARPNMPVNPPTELSSKIFHSSSFIHNFREAYRNGARRMVLIGSGQSAAEILLHCLRYCPDVNVDVICRNYAFSAKEGSPFVNEIYAGESPGRFYEQPQSYQKRFQSRYSNTNLSVAEVGLLHELYKEVYGDKHVGKRLVRFHNFVEVQTVNGDDTSVSVRLQPTAGYSPNGELNTIEADLAVFATGYKEEYRTLLTASPDLASKMCHDDEGNLRLNADYSAVLKEQAGFRIFVNGFATHSHGPTQSVLSHCAQRAGVIVNSVINLKKVNEA